MAKRTYKRISSYLSYKYFSRVNREKWKNEYKDRTGRKTARGWNYSPEYSKYLESEKGRIITYAERNPVQFLQKKDTILRRSSADLSKKLTYSDSPQAGTKYLNPMKGNWGPEKLSNTLEQRAKALGKKLVLINRVQVPPELGTNQVFTTKGQGQNVRGDIMSNYGKNVAGAKAKGSYGLIGADYSVETIVTGNLMLGIIDTELYLY